MIARIRKQLDENKEQGFTLVELLVVIIIIGILAAIAIPLYLNQQAKAKDSAAQSDLKNAQIEVASQLVEDPTNLAVDISGVATSPGVTMDQTVNISGDSFCIDAAVTGGAVGTWHIDEDGGLESGTC